MHILSFRYSQHLLLVVIGCTLLMSGCTVGPDFIEPKPPLTQGYTSEGNDNLHGIQRIVYNKEIPLNWWRTFRSPTLDQVMKQALADNNNLAAGRARLAQAQEEAGAAAEYMYQAKLADYRQVILESFRQVANVLQALKHDGEQVDAQQHALTTAQSSLQLARVSYSAGNIGVLQILDAERLYNQARLGLVRAQIRRYQDTALLYLALGGGSFSATLSAEDR